jgi:hypothetical protein
MLPSNPIDDKRAAILLVLLFDIQKVPENVFPLCMILTSCPRELEALIDDEDDRLFDFLMARGAIGIILKFMVECFSNNGKMEWCCETCRMKAIEFSCLILDQFAMENRQRAGRIVRTGGIGCLLKAMETLPSEEIVQKSALQTLCCLTLHANIAVDDFMGNLRRGGPWRLLEGTIRAMENFPTCDEIHFFGFSVITFAGSRNYIKLELDPSVDAVQQATLLRSVFCAYQGLLHHTFVDELTSRVCLFFLVAILGPELCEIVVELVEFYSCYGAAA